MRLRLTVVGGGLAERVGVGGDAIYAAGSAAPDVAFYRDIDLIDDAREALRGVEGVFGGLVEGVGDLRDLIDGVVLGGGGVAERIGGGERGVARSIASRRASGERLPARAYAELQSGYARPCQGPAG